MSETRISTNSSDSENFAMILAKIMKTDNVNIIEAITTFSEVTGVEITDVVPILDKHTIEKIRLEAVSLNYIREAKPRSLFDIA